MYDSQDRSRQAIHERAVTRADRLTRDRTKALRRAQARGPAPLWLLDSVDRHSAHLRAVTLGKSNPEAGDYSAGRLVGNTSRDLRPIASRRLIAGTVVDATIPFSHGAGFKRRPAVIVDRDRDHVTVYPVTSSPRRGSFQQAHELVRYGVLGLDRACAVVNRPITIRRTEIIDVIATLEHEDATAVLAWNAAPVVRQLRTATSYLQQLAAAA